MKKYQALTLATLLISTSCIEQDFFGLSPHANIKAIEVTNQAGTALINATEATVIIEMPAGVDLSQTEIRTLSLSTFATSTLSQGDVIDFRETVAVTVTAEDGNSQTWQLIPEIATATPQLSNSDFNLWYQANGGYFEPGESAANTIWGTGNPGTQLLGLLSTTPIEIADDNFAPLMETLDNGRLAASLGFPIAAGTIYTGTFDTDKINPADPEAAIDFGVPFAARPSAFKVKYQYEPGPENKDRDGNVLDEPDGCDIYCLLEFRTTDGTRRLATAWFRGTDTQTELSEVMVDFTYGRLSSDFPDYTRPEDDLYVEGDSANIILPSHLTFVASSSFGGATFQGAIGSELVIDDLELIYE
ncbi:MAG: PCMD domain-containing protein [Bacteroidota bacterium]